MEELKVLMDNILVRVGQEKKNETNETKSDESQVSYLKGENGVLKNKNIELTEENNALREEIITLSKDNLEWKNECKNFKISLDSLKKNYEKNETNESKSDEGSENINDLKLEINYLKNKVSEITALKKENAKLQHQLNEILGSKSPECYKCQSLKENIIKLKSDYNKSLKYIEELQEQNDKLLKKSASDTFDSPPSDEKLQAENKALREEIKRLKKSNPSSNNIIMVNKPPMVYENDDRFSDYIFRNPRAEKNTYIKENVGEFLNKLFNSDEK